jgi:hypothetical protein
MADDAPEVYGSPPTSSGGASSTRSLLRRISSVKQHDGKAVPPVASVQVHVEATPGDWMLQLDELLPPHIGQQAVSTKVGLF